MDHIPNCGAKPGLSVLNAKMVMIDAHSNDKMKPSTKPANDFVHQSACIF